MKLKNCLIAATFLAGAAMLASPLAFAEDAGFYAGVTFGNARTQNPFSNATLTKSSDSVVGALAGYQFTENWSSEAFYTDTGKFTAAAGGNIINGHARTWGVNVVGTLVVSDPFALYAKLGIASTRTSASSTVGDVTSATRTTSTAGLGAIYNINKAIDIRLGWDRYGASVQASNGKSRHDINAINLGAVFKF